MPSNLSEQEEFEFQNQLEQEQNQQQPNGSSNYSWRNATSDIARPLLEVGGAVGGSILGGGPETPVGIASGALGYAGGKSAADLLSRSLGVKPSLQNLSEAIQETGSNLKSGAELEATNLFINPILRGAGKAALKGASAYFGPSEEAITTRLNNPSMAEASFPKTSEELAGNLNKLQTNLNQIEDKVWGSLLKLKTEPKSVLIGMLNKIKGDYNVTGGPVVGGARKSAVAAIDDLVNDINSYKQKGVPQNVEQMFDQKQLRQIIQSVSEDVDYSDPSKTSKNEALASFRHYLSEYLKGQNPQYADLIQQSAERTALLDNAGRNFSLKKVSGEFVPSDNTSNKIKSLLDEKKIQSQQIADQVKKLTGMDLQEAAKLAQQAGEFEKTATQGSRRAVMGKTVGAAIGGVVGHGLGGAAAGAMAGGYADKYAAQNLGGILDYLNKLGLNQGLEVNPLTSLGLLVAGKERTE